MTKTNHFGICAVAFALAALGAMLLLAATKPAEATFPGENGVISFESERSSEEGDHSNIYSIAPDGTDETMLTDPATWDNNPSYSADGSGIVFDSVRDGNTEIYKMDADGENETRLTEDTDPFFTFDGEPSLSPDGSRIAFARNNEKGSNSTDKDIDIHTMSANGGTATRLVHVDGLDGQPSFVPSGEKVIFHNVNTDTIYIVDADGTDLTPLAEGADPAFSPDGTLIYFERAGQILVMDSNGENERPVTQPDELSSTNIQPAFSPDCARIAYVKDTFVPNPDPEGEPGSGTTVVDIYTSDLDGSNEQRVTTSEEYDYRPSWQPLSSAGEVSCEQPGEPDTTPPVITVPEGVTVDAEAPNGAVVEYQASAGDDVDGTVAVDCVPASGSVFPMGSTTVECDAADAAGNGASASFEVYVKGAGEQISDLITVVEELEVNRGTKNSLLVKLRLSERFIERGHERPACGQLRAFINQVEAQSGRKLTEEQAEQLVASAERIRAVLDC